VTSTARTETRSAEKNSGFGGHSVVDKGAAWSAFAAAAIQRGSVVIFTMAVV